MKLSPLARYDEPAYPTSEILYAQPELLRLTPRRWQGNAVLLGVLGAVCGLSAPALALGPSSPLERTEALFCLVRENDPVLMGDVAPPRVPTIPAIPPTCSTRGILPNKDMTRYPLVITRGITSIAVRPTAEHLATGITARGATVTLTRAATTITLTQGSARAVVNGKAVQMPAPARLHNGNLYAPARFLVETLGGTVDWKSAARTLTIRATASDPGITFTARSKHHRTRVIRRRQAAVSPTLPDTRRAAVRDYLQWLRGQGMV
ncbi:MAG: copper amine oxidase N-terminal domain-containing protein [Armatimonadota bacterium]